jgi:hypothetical protein
MNGGKDYNCGVVKELIKICSSYLDFDLLIPFDGLRKLI